MSAEFIRKPEDHELGALHVIVESLLSLDLKTRGRVLSYLTARFGGEDPQDDGVIQHIQNLTALYTDAMVRLEVLESQQR